MAHGTRVGSHTPYRLASPSVTFGVSFFAVFLGHSLCTKEKEFYCLQGRSEGLFRKMTLVFPCFAVSATYEQVEVPRELPGAREIPKQKMTLGRARYRLKLLLLASVSSLS